MNEKLWKEMQACEDEAHKLIRQATEQEGSGHLVIPDEAFALEKRALQIWNSLVAR